MADSLFLVKGIKPARLRVTEVRQKILNALRAEGRDQRKVLEPTVATWKGEKPDFESLIGLERGANGSASVLTGPTGSEKAVNKWVWLDLGTKAHIIRARRLPTLIFRVGGFVSKTRPGSFQSRGGRRASGPRVRPRSVSHPGTKARGWSEMATKRRRRPFTRRMVKAMQVGAGQAFK